MTECATKDFKDDSLSYKFLPTDRSSEMFEIPKDEDDNSVNIIFNQTSSAAFLKADRDNRRIGHTSMRPFCPFN